jgi:hypothetical protein
VSLSDSIRTLLKIRQERQRLPAGIRPCVGAKIVMGGVRMTVEPGMSDELWHFLVQAGFREVTYRPDRRRYREVPRSQVVDLYKAPSERWRELLRMSLREAVERPKLPVA